MSLMIASQSSPVAFGGLGLLVVGGGGMEELGATAAGPAWPAGRPWRKVKTSPRASSRGMAMAAARRDLLMALPSLLMGSPPGNAWPACPLRTDVRRRPRGWPCRPDAHKGVVP